MSSDKWSVSVYLLSLSLAAQLMKIEFYAQQCQDSHNGAVAVVFGFIYTCFISLNLDQKRTKRPYQGQAYISLRGDQWSGLNSARAHLERVLSLHDSVD